MKFIVNHVIAIQLGEGKPTLYVCLNREDNKPMLNEDVKLAMQFKDPQMAVTWLDRIFLAEVTKTEREQDGFTEPDFSFRDSLKQHLKDFPGCISIKEATSINYAA